MLVMPVCGVWKHPALFTDDGWIDRESLGAGVLDELKLFALKLGEPLTERILEQISRLPSYNVQSLHHMKKLVDKLSELSQLTTTVASNPASHSLGRTQISPHVLAAKVLVTVPMESIPRRSFDISPSSLDSSPFSSIAN
jgi:hypothetical protein